MSKTVFFPLLFFITLGISAQENNSIDFYSKIKSAVTDSASQYYYPNLLEKVKTNPVDITEEDCYYLYYGEVFQPNYNPIGGGLSFLRNPERKDFDRAAMNGNCKKVIKLGKIMLNRNPVDLMVLLHTSICIDEQKKYIDDDYISQRYKNLLSAIFSTGDGRTKETAIKVISPEDDYVLKGTLGFFGGEEKLISDHTGASTRVFSVWEKNGMKLYFEEVINSEK